jgi:hypothetical protein
MARELGRDESWQREQIARFDAERRAAFSGL